MTLPASLADDLRRYVEALDRHFGGRLVSVVLFGSWARWTARPDSDLDLLVVIRDLPSDRSEPRRDLYEVPREVSQALADAISPVVLTPEEAERVKPYSFSERPGPIKGAAGTNWLLRFPSRLG